MPRPVETTQYDRERCAHSVLGVDVVVGDHPADRRRHRLRIRSRRGLDQDVAGLALQHLGQLLRVAEVHEHDGRGGERGRLGGGADDLEAPAEHLAVVAHREGAEAAHRRAVHEHVAAAAEVGRLPLVHLPGQVPAREVVERVDEAPFLGAARQLDVHERDDEVVGAGDPGHAADAQDRRLRERVREVHVGRLVRRHPDVGVGVPDRHRRLVEQPHEEADLHQHQRHRERDAGDGDDEAGPVVEEVLAREGNHQPLLCFWKPRRPFSRTWSTRSGAGGAPGN